MSIYNAIHGENTAAPLLLGLLGLRREDIPRYRDCWWDGHNIAIHTRTGGGNRDYYDSPERHMKYEGADSTYTGPFNADLRALPTFVREEDDTFDNTYATFYFEIPQSLRPPALAALEAEHRTPAERWGEVLTKLNDPASKDDPQVVRAHAALQPVIDALERMLKP